CGAARLTVAARPSPKGPRRCCVRETPRAAMARSRRTTAMGYLDSGAQYFDRVAQCETPTLDDLGVDAEFRVAVMLAQLGHRVRVALRGLGVPFGRRASHDPFGHLKHGTAKLDVLTDPVTLGPWHRAAEPDVGAEAPALAARADLRLEIMQTRHADQADDLLL